MMCMAEEPVRELKQNTAGVLAQVKRGETTSAIDALPQWI
jgi:hypothetical protein